MVERKTIRTLGALRRRKAVLKREMEASREELRVRAYSIQSDVQKYALRRVVVPVALLATLVYVGSKLLSDKSPTDQAEVAATNAVPAPAESTPSRQGFITTAKQWWPFIQSALTFAASYYQQRQQEQQSS